MSRYIEPVQLELPLEEPDNKVFHVRLAELRARQDDALNILGDLTRRALEGRLYWLAVAAKSVTLNTPEPSIYTSYSNGCCDEIFTCIGAVDTLKTRLKQNVQ